MQSARSSKSGGRYRKNKGQGINGSGDVVVKRLTIPGGQITTTAGSVIAVDTSTKASTLASATEFSSFAARYQQFRVRSVRLILEPCWPGSSSPSPTTFTHGCLYVGDYIGNSPPGSAAQVLADERAVVVNTSKRVDYLVDWSRNPNAKLWNPVGAAMPTANDYAIAFVSNTSAVLSPSTVYYLKVTELVVEFRGSQ